MDEVEDPEMFREKLDKFIDKYPELFPEGIRNGYLIKEIRRPCKLNVPVRRITVDSIPYTIRPSYI